MGQRILWPTSPAALLGCLAAVINGVLRVALVPLFVTPLFNEVVSARDTTALPRVLLVAALVAVGGSLALWAQDSLLGHAAATLAARWRQKLYSGLLAAEPGSLPGSSGALSSRILGDLKEVETYFRFGLGTLVAESVTLLLVFALLVRADAGAAVALVLLALPTLLVLRWVGGHLQRVAERSMREAEEVGKHLQEGLKHHETVTAFGARRFMLDRFRPANLAVRRAATKRSVIAGLQVPIAQLLVFTAIGVLVVFLVNAVNRGTLTVGEVVSFLTLVALAATPTQLLPHGYAMFRQAAAAAGRLQELEASADRGGAPRQAAPPPGHSPERRSASLEGRGAPLLDLRGVSYSYEGGHPVLQRVDLSLPSTGLVVVAGASGSGKTTLLRLLLGLARPSSGTVLLDGLPLELVPEAELRGRLAYVPQEHGLLSGPVRDALRMGRAADDAELWSVLDSVGMREAIEGMPGGLGAELGEDGGGLSGGQRQRLAVARALLGRPEAVLLDEPTSNLDDDSERSVVALLRELSAARLVLAVTHRPALAQAADRLLEAHGTFVEPSTGQR